MAYVHETKCHLHCDNCVGQNKNNSVAGYLAWRTYYWKASGNYIAFHACWPYTLPCIWPFRPDKNLLPVW